MFKLCFEQVSIKRRQSWLVKRNPKAKSWKQEANNLPRNYYKILIFALSSHTHENQATA